ncbi:MAG: substrate-binding domain-containing protein [Planctomycetota bacterium]
MRVLALVDCVQSYGRGVLAGMARYANAHGGWTISLDHHNQSRQRLPALRRGTSAVIAYALRPGLIDALRSTGLPTVNTSSGAADPGMPAVVPDDRAIGRLAADDFIARGYRRLVALQLPIWHFSRVRAEAFVEHAQEAGCHASVLRLPSWPSAEASVRELLEQCPTPVGVFASSDMLAVFVVRQAMELRRTMPEQVAVLGVDNDELTSQMMEPRISSVAIPWQKLGFEAAAMLDRLVQGKTLDADTVRIPPTGIVTRQTTNGLAIDDHDVAAAIGYVRQHLTEPISTADVLRSVPLSRRSLEVRFKRAVGQTLQSYITAMRIERSKRLLAETDFAIPEIAARSGFVDPTYFATVFRKTAGESPSAFRSKSRLA